MNQPFDPKFNWIPFFISLFAFLISVMALLARILK